MGLVFWLVNCWRALLNLWRRMWRRRVDYVRIRLNGPLPELVAPPNFWQRRLLGAREQLSVSSLRRLLQRIADDPQTQGVLLDIGAPIGGWATLQSVRDELVRFRAAGRRVVAYLPTPDLAGYYLACAADEIILPPLALFNVVGLRVEVRFLKDALAKLGISAEVTAVSPYKSGGDTLARAEISPEAREQLERLLDERYHMVVEAIAAARNRTPETVRELIDNAPYGASAARDHGLVDALLYEDEFEAHLQRGEHAPVILELDAARRALRLAPLRGFSKAVGVVAVEGTIVSGTSRSVPIPIPLIGGRMAGSDSIIQALRQAERNRRIAAVVVYVNSPGGDAFASDLIWREVLRLQRTKPVVVAMGDVAASGGYYIAAPAAAIVAQPGTLTGSIGVFIVRPVLADLFERIGVNTVVLQRGANSGFLSGDQVPTDREREALGELVFRSYDEFKQRVRDGRTMSDEQLEPIAGGRVWTGREAQGLRLVDQIGGIPEALLKAQELAGLVQDRRAPLILMRAGRAPIAPQPFPVGATLDSLIAEALRPRVWAALPFAIDD